MVKSTCWTSVQCPVPCGRTGPGILSCPPRALTGRVHRHTCSLLYTWGKCFKKDLFVFLWISISVWVCALLACRCPQRLERIRSPDVRTISGCKSPEWDASNQIQILYEQQVLLSTKQTHQPLNLIFLRCSLTMHPWLARSSLCRKAGLELGDQPITQVWDSRHIPPHPVLLHQTSIGKGTVLLLYYFLKTGLLCSSG